MSIYEFDLGAQKVMRSRHLENMETIGFDAADPPGFGMVDQINW